MKRSIRQIKDSVEISSEDQEDSVSGLEDKGDESLHLDNNKEKSKKIMKI